MSWFLLRAPWDCSGQDRGEAKAPTALRAAGLSPDLDPGGAHAASLVSLLDRLL